MKTTRLHVSGMTCGHCASTVEKALQSRSGVQKATVDLGSGSAEVEYDDGAVAPDQLAEAVRQSGYEAQVAAGDAPAAS